MTSQKQRCSREVDLRRLVPLGITAALGLVALVVLCRAAAGALARSPTPLSACLVSVTAFGISVQAWRWDELLRGTSDLRDRIARGLAACAAPLTIGLTAAGSSPFAIGLTMALAFLSAAWFFMSCRTEFSAQSVGPKVAMENGVAPAAAHLATPGEGEEVDVSGEAPTMAAFGDHPDAACPLDDPGVSQQIVRRTLADGGDSLEALLRVPFVAGAREAVIQLPIHPPLSGQPLVECEPLDSIDLSFSIAAARPFGVRIEVRRAAPFDRPQTALVGVAIHAACVAEAAA